MKKTVWLAILFVVAVIGLVIATTFSGTRVRVEVCLSFRGRSDCRTVQAATKEDALRTATQNVCAQLASGVTDSIQCENTQPVSVTWK